MMSSAALLLLATFSVAVLAQPLSESPTPSSADHAPSSNSHTQRLQKRTVSKEPNAEELAVLKDLILSRVASELSQNLQSQAAKRAKEEDEREKEAAEEAAILAEAKAKRMLAPLAGLQGDMATMKRQIRYHQCYFNPISCFRRK